MRMDLIIIITIIIFVIIICVGSWFLKVVLLKKIPCDNNKDSEINSYETDIYNYHATGNVYYKKGNYDKAIECFEKISDLKPDCAEAYNNIGAAYFGKGNYYEAIKYYEKAIELKPDYEDVYYNMGIVYQALGNQDKANDCFQKAV